MRFQQYQAKYYQTYAVWPTQAVWRYVTCRLTHGLNVCVAVSQGEEKQRVLVCCLLVLQT